MKSRRANLFYIFALFSNALLGNGIHIENHRFKPNHLWNQNDDNDLNSPVRYDNLFDAKQGALDEESVDHILRLLNKAEYLSNQKNLARHPPPSVHKHNQRQNNEVLQMFGMPDVSRAREVNTEQQEHRKKQEPQKEPRAEQKIVVVQAYEEPHNREPSKTVPAASKMIMDDENLKLETQKDLDQNKIQQFNKNKALRKELETNMNNKEDIRLASLLPHHMASAFKENEEAWLQLKTKQSSTLTQMYLLAVIAGCSVAAFTGLIVAAACWYRHKRNVKNPKGEFPGYGITGPNLKDKASPGDRKLAQNAQMYHYQHQKQQMIASERAATDGGNGAASDEGSDEENEEGDFTVFECPGLATTGEMEVQNPMFKDSSGTTAILAPNQDVPTTHKK